MVDPLIRTERLSVRYNGRPALCDVEFSAAEHRITAVVGPSGCGKSTLLSSMNRMTDLVEGCVVEGDVFIAGERVTAPECDLLALRRRVGMIFQHPSPFPLSIRRNIELPLREHGVRDTAEMMRRCRLALERVGLWDEVADRLDSPALELSGGQQQRLCIARAVALEPEVLLLDEPCSSLDPIAAGIVEDLIVDLARTYTLVVVTHNLAQARRIADDVALFWLVDGAGTVVEAASTEAFFENPSHELTRAYVAGERG